MAFFTAVFAASVMDGEELASGPACWSAGFWHPTTSMPTDKADAQIVARRRFIKSSTGWTVVFKHTLIHCEVNLPWSALVTLVKCRILFPGTRCSGWCSGWCSDVLDAEFIVVYCSLNPSSPAAPN